MNKREKFKDLLRSLNGMDKQFLKSSLSILNAANGKLYSMDLLSSAVNNRALQLTKGFVVLARMDNFISAIPLIRLQLDNALRFFATTLVANYDDFFLHFIDGKPIKDYKDAGGRRLTDNYLASEVDKHFSGTLNLYNNTSAHIHLSEKHFFAIAKEVDQRTRSLKMAVGHKVNNFSADDKIGFLQTMLQVSNLVLIVLEQWKHHKDLRLSPSK